MPAELCEDAKELDFLITRMKDLLVEYMDQSRASDGLLVDYKEPEELERIMDFSLPDHGVGSQGIFPTITQTLKHSVNTFSPRFMDKLYAGSSPIGVMSELLLSGLNGNSHVYHVSPVFTMMEIHVTRALARLFGFTGPLAGGLSCPGGSASNQLAMVTARNVLFPEIKKRGYFPRWSVQERRELERQLGITLAEPSTLSLISPTSSTSTYGKLIAFTSSAGHYSLEKSAVIMGLGSENIACVPCDSTGAMIPSELERLIQEHIAMGHTPFFINCTAGTTVLGAFDPIRPCGEIAKKYNCWLHVDGSWGGCTIFVPELAKTLLDGSEMADSITINPHKMLQTPLQCSLLLVKDSSIFPRANALKANYLFHDQSHDLGDGTLGCGRRSDAIKFFLGWKYYGKLGYQARVEKSLSNVKRFIEILTQDDYHGQRIQMLRLGDGDENGKSSQPSLLQVCFWYRPRGSRLIDWQGTEILWKNEAEQQQQEQHISSALPHFTAPAVETDIEAESEASLINSSITGQLYGHHDSSSRTSPSNSSAVSLSSSDSMSSASSASLSTAHAGIDSDPKPSTSSSSARPVDHGLILTDPEEREEARAWMEKVIKAIHARIRTRGMFMIDYAPLGRYLPIFFRVVLNPPTIRELDLVMLVDEILECGELVEKTIPIPVCCRA